VIEARVWFSGWICDAFLGLDGLVQAFGQAAAGHHAAGELVDQHDLAALDDVVLVARDTGCWRAGPGSRGAPRDTLAAS
jgi:hypothetical protein